MANRRMGGMGGGLRGNRSQQPFGGGGGVNPWQGGMSHNSMGQGLLSQLTSNPQQLALALTSLLQPQQQHPPSLLSLNTSPAFSNQNRDFNRFGPNNRSRDFRRHEPYNKNQQNRHSGGNNNRNNDRRRSGGNNQNQANKKEEKKPNEAAAAKRKLEESLKKEKEASLDDTNEEGGDTKRDWKDEKNNAEEKREESEVEEENKEKTRQDKAGPYYDIPAKFLRCFVCNKVMWDGESMQKHIKGRAHKEMLGTLEESIHITVNILRENMRLMEERKVIEMQRVQRGSKRFKQSNEIESHCNMCDLKFFGKILSHRRNEGHQRLKRYLHPVCRMCDKEFPSRMEWIEHCLTPEHLRKLNEVLSAKSGSADVDIILTEDDNELNIEPLLEESLQVEAENPVLELTDDLTGLQNLMPAYKPERPLSTQSLKPFSGFKCELCHRSFETEETAQKHLKTKLHYYQFIGACKKKLKEQQKKEREEKEAKKAAELEEKEEKDEAQVDAETGDQEMYDPEEATNDETSTAAAAMDQDEDGGDGDASVIHNADLIEMVDEEEEEEEGGEEENEPTEAEETAVLEEEEAAVEVPPAPVIKVEEVKKEPPVKKEPVQTSTPTRQTVQRAAAQKAVGAVQKAAAVGAVRNGAGPKSKKMVARK